MSYSISVSAKNFLNMSSDVITIQLKKIDSEDVSVQINGPSLVRSDQKLRLKVDTQFCGDKANSTDTNNLPKYRVRKSIVWSTSMTEKKF